MCLELVHDILDNNTNTELDKEVVEKAVRAPTDLLGATILLSAVVLASNDTLDSNYKETLKATALLEEYPALVGMLTEAWREGSFKCVRNLSVTSLLFSRMIPLFKM